MKPLPYSIDAEENLLSVVMIDGPDVVRQCIEAGITPASFYDPNHGKVFAAALALYRRNDPVDQSTIAIELSKDSVGSVSEAATLIANISAKVPTTEKATFFVTTVREYAERREAIRTLSATVETLTTDLTTATSNVVSSVVTWVSGASLHRSADMGWDELMAFDPKTDPDCLLGDRFLSRTDGLVIVAPSGVGKSVLSLQMGACCALGRPLLGLRVAAPLRVLYVQAEDSLGDVAEAVQGFAREYKLTKDDLRQLKKQMRIVRWNDVSGERFLARLRSEFHRFPFDLVIVNPLYSFYGGDVCDQREMSVFLRNGLNPILNETRAVAVIVHHTPKVKDDDKSKGGGGDVVASYAAAGSAELTNWPRACITLQQVRAAGSHVYKMVFAKRGNRAGLIDEEGRRITSILIEHSKHGLCWVPSNYEAAKDAGGKFTPKLDLARAARVYDPNLDWSANEQAIALDQNVCRKTVKRAKETILDTVP